MRRLALVVLLGLGAWDCNFYPDLGCGGVVVGQQQLDFEGACEGDSCNLTTLGAITTVPSLLPGDHARALFAAASITWTLGVPGDGEGTSLAMSYRCDEGGSLRVELEGSGLAPLPIEPTVDWQRRVWPLRAALTSFPSVEAASAGRHQAVVRVTNTGRALCAVDWLRYVAAPRVCANSSACSRLSPPESFCDGTCADTRRDRRHCGACGVACATGTYCEGGRCISGSGFCPGACDEVECGPNRCGTGSCGSCGSGESCALGRCSRGDAGPRDVPVRDVPSTDAGAPSRTAVVAGRRCTDDEACDRAAADLACTALPGGRICSGVRGCDQGTTAQEEAQCGGRFSTCLVLGNPADGAQASACTRACVATAVTEATGACPAGSVCTTNWLQLRAAQTERAGCLPFCAGDGDCAGLTGGDASLARCNARTGRCGGAASDPALRADGMPCDPQEVERTMVSQCRGVCFAVDPMRPTQGLCGSFINLRTATGGCPDGAGFEPRTVADDALGLCYLRGCERDDQCAPGLVCVHPEDPTTGVRVDAPRSCSYPTALQPVGATGDAGVRADVAMD